MGETIELSTDLTNLRNNHFLVAVALVRAKRTSGALGVHVVLPAGVERHVPSQHMA